MTTVRFPSRDCRACALGSLGLAKSDGFGPTGALVAVVGINPSVRAGVGKTVSGAFLIPFLDRMQSRGRPFSALRLVGAERAFAALVEESGLDLSEVYSTNGVKCATPGNRKPTYAEVRTCRETYLLEELGSLLNLRAVLVFGKSPGESLGLSAFGATATIEGTTAEGILLKHPVATLRKWTTLRRRASTIREFLRKWSPTSLRGAFAPARP